MALRVWFLCLVVLIFTTRSASAGESLRALYSAHPSTWPPAETSDNEVPLPLAPLAYGNKEPEAKVALGKALFNETLLSADKTISCASCHQESLTFSDGLGQAVGVDGQVGARNTPPVFGIQHWKSFFWDGRVLTAQEQALKPIENPVEMALPLNEARRRLNESEKYRKLFDGVYGSANISLQQLADALVAYEETIPPPDTLFQQFIRAAYVQTGDPVSMLSDSEVRGLHLFRTKAKCMTCHEGALLSDNAFHNTGLHNYGRPFEDLGRFDATKELADIGKFRTPSLLGVSKTGPWMHNGLFVKLTDMISIYNVGGFRPKPKRSQRDDPNFPVTTPLLQPLALSDAEMADLAAFLMVL